MYNSCNIKKTLMPTMDRVIGNEELTWEVVNGRSWVQILSKYLLSKIPRGLNKTIYIFMHTWSKLR